MKTLYYTLVASGIALALAACGGSDSESEVTVQTSTFTLSVSDAPVDDANKVVLAFEDVVLVPFDPDTGLKTGDPLIFELGDDGLHTIDLMMYQGSNAEAIVSSASVAPGDYAMCLYAKDGRQMNDDSSSYVEKTDGNLKGLVLPSKGSCFGTKPDTSNQGRLKFSGGGEYVKIHTGHNSYVVEFDLRQGMADPQGLDYMLMNSNAVSLVNASEAGHIAGVVTQEQYDACVADSAALNAIEDVDAVHAVYLYPNVVVLDNDDNTLNEMGDLGANKAVPSPDLIEPVAVANVVTNNDDPENVIHSYEFGYIGPGTYTLGYTCTAYVDSPDSHETATEGFAFYQDYSPVDVLAGETVTQDIVLVPPPVVVPDP